MKNNANRANESKESQIPKDQGKIEREKRDWLKASSALLSAIGALLSVIAGLVADLSVKELYTDVQITPTVTNIISILLGGILLIASLTVVTRRYLRFRNEQQARFQQFEEQTLNQLNMNIATAIYRVAGTGAESNVE